MRVLIITESLQAAGPVPRYAADDVMLSSMLQHQPNAQFLTDFG